MAYGNLVRLGGIFGLLSVVAVIPAYLVGSPDLPGSPEEAGSYFESGLGTFVFSNGVLPLLHIFFFILFLGVLYGLLRGAEEDGDRGGAGGVRGALPAAALAGGISFATLEAAGFVVALLTLSHVVLGLVAALVGLLWIAAVSVLMLTGGVGGSTGGPRRRTVHR